MIIHGTSYLRSDKGAGFTAKNVRSWLKETGAITAHIELSSPWENGYCESFSAQMRDEFLNCELFGGMYEAQVLTERWVGSYNEVRSHSALGGKVPQTIVYPAGIYYGNDCLKRRDILLPQSSVPVKNKRLCRLYKKILDTAASLRYSAVRLLKA